MALTTATITFDISDQLGNEFDPRRTKVWVTTNTDTVIDTAGDKIRLGSGNVTLNADGTGSIVVWVPGTGSNPASWQTTVHVDYPDRNATGGRRTKSFGPFTITADANLADLVAEMPVQPEYASEVFTRLDALEADSGTGEALAALGDRLDGVNDHGNVTGTLAIDPAKGYHVFDATGPTEVTLGDPPGNSVSFKAITGADDVTVDGLADLVLTDDQWATFVYYRAAWHLAAAGASGGGTVEPVIDPPTQPGVVTVDPTTDGYALTWVASTVAAGYEVQIDGGTWVDSGTDLAHTYTGLASGSSHSGAVRAYNSIGERSTARTWGPSSVDTASFHDVIMSMEPEVYFRATDGTFRDYSRITGTWAEVTGLTAGDHTGPALTPGDTSSFKFAPNSQVNRNLDGLLVGATSFTAMIVLGAPSDVGAGVHKAFFGNERFVEGSWGSESYLSHQPGGVHTWFTDWDGTSMIQQIEDNPGGGGISFGLASPLTTPSPALLQIHGNEFGNYDGNGGYVSHIVVWKNVVLTTEQRTALVTAASTKDNTPTGG